MKLCIALLSSMVFVACSMTPKVSVTGQQTGPDIDFTIQADGINGLAGVRLWQVETKELYWDVNLASFMGSHLKYGEVPAHFKAYNGATYSARQNFPVDD